MSKILQNPVYDGAMGIFDDYDHCDSDLKHLIIFDYTSSGHLRIECLDCHTQIIKQPYMTQSQWREKVKQFLNDHYNNKLQKYYHDL